MNYEQKYKEALERAKGFRTDECKDVAEYIFPELKESEDERIRKEIYQFVIEQRPEKEWIAWLEKQGEVMKDAIETTVKVDAGGYPYIDRVIELYDYDKDIPLAKEGDKVKLVVVREE